MLKKTILFKIMFVILFFACKKTFAQTPQIDTIVVDLAKDTIKKKSKDQTPTLNLEALKNAAKADSIKMAEIAEAKKASEAKKLEDLKLKRLQEKEAKEKKQRELAEKRKLEKEAREKALAEKKALRQAEEKKKKEEKKLAKAKAKEKQKLDREKKKAESLAKKKAEEQKKKANTLSKKKAEESKKANELNSNQAKKAEEEKNKAALAQKKAAEEKAKSEKLAREKAKSTGIQKNRQLEKTETPTSSKKEDIKIPEGVVQKDNAYGTVRLAYDDLAASFLLTIPTETKMSYHKDHSEHIMLVEGEGMVLMGYKTIKLKKNELIFITKGTPHKIISSGRSKLKVLSIMSPFYSGKDIIILE